MFVSSRVRVIGPLAEHSDGFRAKLFSLGYTDESSASQMRLMADLSRWLACEHVNIAMLQPDAIERFFESRRRRGFASKLSPQALRPLVKYLAALGVIEVCVDAPPESSTERLLDRYRNYLLDELGLSEGTIRLYVTGAASFIKSCGLFVDITLENLTAGDVTSFVVREAPKRSNAVAKNLVVALRSFLRFCFAEGLTNHRLDAAVPGVASWRASSLPRPLRREAVEDLLATCDRTNPVGQRDYAILLLLWRLGLRAGEVAALSLDDVDWRNGEIVVHGKGGRDERVPLPVDVGEALADYLRPVRPSQQSRRLFLRVHAPTDALTSGGIRWTVRAACNRAGVPEVGTHRFRHAVAGELLHEGAPLSEIAQLLRHHSIDTTAIYAKVDRSSLAFVARPWPGESR